MIRYEPELRSKVRCDRNYREGARAERKARPKRVAGFERRSPSIERVTHRRREVKGDATTFLWRAITSCNLQMVVRNPGRRGRNGLATMAREFAEVVGMVIAKIID